MKCSRHDWDHDESSWRQDETRTSLKISWLTFCCSASSSSTLRRSVVMQNGPLLFRHAAAFDVSGEGLSHGTGQFAQSHLEHHCIFLQSYLGRARAITLVHAPNCEIWHTRHNPSDAASCGDSAALIDSKGKDGDELQ